MGEKKAEECGDGGSSRQLDTDDTGFPSTIFLKFFFWHRLQMRRCCFASNSSPGKNSVLNCSNKIKDCSLDFNDLALAKALNPRASNPSLITAMKKTGTHHQIPSEEMSSVAIDLKNLATR